jgi:antagonist of KipI
VSTLLVITSGLLTTVQDLGRWGLRSRGVAVAGPMDPFGHRLANALVGNRRDAATLEVTLTGPELEFDDERVAAVSGAQFELILDGRPVPCEAPFAVGKASRLRFGSRLRGARAYLAVEGGVAVAPTLGSRATHLASRMGGVAGRALASGDRLPLGGAHRGLRTRSPVARPFVRTLPQGAARVRVMPGPDSERFDRDALDRLQASPYTITRDSNRMGFRLAGPTIPLARGADLISDATAFGVLQVPASGQPMLLMADHQTTGGYPRLAAVIAADLGVAGQLAPGDAISFSLCSHGEAVAALISQERVLMAAEGAGKS